MWSNIDCNNENNNDNILCHNELTNMFFKNICSILWPIFPSFLPAMSVPWKKYNILSVFFFGRAGRGRRASGHVGSAGHLHLQEYLPDSRTGPFPVPLQSRRHVTRGKCIMSYVVASRQQIFGGSIFFSRFAACNSWAIGKSIIVRYSPSMRLFTLPHLLSAA